jgi:hypothetical protein
MDSPAQKADDSFWNTKNLNSTDSFEGREVWVHLLISNNNDRVILSPNLWNVF